MARPSSSAVQLKAVLILALLAGHEANRITQEAEVFAGHRSRSGNPEEDFKVLNKECKWSTPSFRCLGDGCAWRSLPLDWPPPADESCRRTDEWMEKHDGVKNLKMSTGVLAAKSEEYAASCKGASSWLNPRCVRRAKEMMRAMKFIAKADSNKDLMNSLSPEDKTGQKELFETSLGNMASTMGKDGPYIEKLVNKMKANQAVKKDPQGSIDLMVKLLWKLKQGSRQQKDNARAVIDSMSTSPLTEEEEAKADRENLQLADQLDGLDGEGDVDRLIDAVDIVAPDNEVAPTTGAGSLMEVHRGWAVNAIAFSILAALVVVVVIFSVVEIIGAIVAWALMAVLGCGAHTVGHDLAAADSNNKIAKKGFTGFAECFVKIFALPFVLVGNAVVATWNYFFKDPKKGSLLQLGHKEFSLLQLAMIHNGTVH